MAYQQQDDDDHHHGVIYLFNEIVYCKLQENKKIILIFWLQ